MRQRGIVHRRQLYEGGLTREQLRWALGRRWTAVLPGVVATFTGALDDDQQLVAALLYAGDPAILTATEALRLHGVRYLPRRRTIRVLVRERRRRRQAGQVVVQPTVRFDAGSSVRGFPAATPARALVDAATELRDQPSTTAVVLDVVQRGLSTVTALRHEIERGPVRGSGRVRRALAAAELGAWSRPEADLLAVVGTSAVLPPPAVNPLLVTPTGQVVARPDLWFGEVGLAVQVHSREHHTVGLAFDRTLRTDSLLTAAGATVLAFTPAQIRDDAATVLSTVEVTYRRLADAGTGCALLESA
ncbi:hypothetical protein GCM10027194_06840 [Thalassiella azotivora]